MKKILVILGIFLLLVVVASYLSVDEIRKRETQQKKVFEQQQKQPKKITEDQHAGSDEEQEQKMKNSSMEKGVYRNEYYKFSLEYPESWSFSTSESGGWVVFLPPDKQPGPEYSGDIAVKVSENPKKLSLENYFDGNNGPNYFNKSEVIKINYNNAILVENVNEMGVGDGKVYIIDIDVAFLVIDAISSFDERDGMVNSIQTFQIDETADWQTYRNEEFGFELKYPNSWVLSKATREEYQNYGKIVSFQTTDTDDLIKQKKLSPGNSQNLVISHWKSINNSYAKGGAWVGEWEYKDLDDYFTDKLAMKKKNNEISLGGKNGYEVTIGGYGTNYGIMIENDGIYELNFERINDKSQLGSIESDVISSFKFLD